tara:strand:+ start:55 stop:609 length:555 start_codon:yes stop_codon:yes gene_type:complete
MKALSPETYLISLVSILFIIAILVARQLLRVRKDESTLIKLEKGGASNSTNSYELYELASVQLKKRLYPQATGTLKKALKELEGEPEEAKALLENALGFSMAAENKFKEAIIHYRNAIKAKANYPVALNNLAFAKQKLLQEDEAIEIYKNVLSIDPNNKTASKQLNRIGKRDDKTNKNSNEKGF